MANCHIQFSFYMRAPSLIQGIIHWAWADFVLLQNLPHFLVFFPCWGWWAIPTSWIKPRWPITVLVSNWRVLGHLIRVNVEIILLPLFTANSLLVDKLSRYGCLIYLDPWKCIVVSLFLIVKLSPERISRLLPSCFKSYTQANILAHMRVVVCGEVACRDELLSLVARLLNLF